MRDTLSSNASEMAQARAFFSNYLQFSVRSRALLIPCAVLAATVLLALSGFGDGNRTLPSSPSAFAAGLVANSFLLIAASSASLGGFAIANDYVQTTSTYVLALPVRRRTVFLGRFLAALVAGSGIIAAYYAFCAGAVWYYYGSVPAVTLASSFMLAVLFLGAALGCGFLVSAVLKNERLAMFGTLLLIWIAMPLIQQQLVADKLSPVPLLSYAGLAAGAILGDSSGPFGATGTPDPLVGALVMIGYLAISLVVGIVVYTHSEIK